MSAIKDHFKNFFTFRLNCNFAMSFSWGVFVAPTSIEPPRNGLREQQRIKQKWCVSHLTIMNYSNLVQLSKECPDLVVSIKLCDLMEANTLLIANVKSELEQTIADQNAETYLSRDKVKEILEIGDTTLWRWQKSGYLVPINVGGKRRFRKSDINRILEGEK